MISPENIAPNYSTSDADFTVEHYRELLKLVKVNWEVARYNEIPWGARFILWRHDIDYSLNRSLALAKIEWEHEVKATYFVNLHSEFYNLADLSQFRIVQKILSLGHDLGLHFDAAFYDISNDFELDRLVAREARYLEELFEVKPVAFSFHNPMSAHLSYEADEYGGLINCYSQRFKKEVAYCSDSNGYWRFRRLYDVLASATDACLQVLTHPGWWQDKPMPPRQRIFRSAYGRAVATMRLYDSGLYEHGRLNHAGEVFSLRFLMEVQPKLYELCDYLWNHRYFQSLFIELWRLHEAQIYNLCKAYFQSGWSIPEHEINRFFDKHGATIVKGELFNAVFDKQWSSVASVDESEYLMWVKVRDQVYRESVFASDADLEAGCVYLCQLIEKVAAWGQEQVMAYDGLTLVTNVIPTSLNTRSSERFKWESLIASFATSRE